MKRKFLSLLLAACMLTSFASCDGNEDGKKKENPEPDPVPQSWEIGKDEWEYAIKADDFSVSSTNNALLENGDVISLDYEHHRLDGVYNNAVEYTVTVKDSTAVGGAKEFCFVKEMQIEKDDEVIGYFLKTGEASYEREEVTEAQYNEYVGKYLALTDYIGGGYDQFTSVMNDADSGYYDGGYTCDLATMSAQNATLAAMNIDKLIVSRFDGMSVKFSVGEKKWNLVYANPLKKAFEKTDMRFGYSVKGGPSETDADYAEYYIKKDVGFRIYTPNNPVENRKEAFYKKEGDAYTGYTKLDSGEWSVSETNASTYENIIDGIIDTYIPFFKEINVNNFRLKRKDDYNTVYVFNNVETGENKWSADVGYNTHHFYDIEVVLVDNYVASANWKMKITQGTASSAEYTMAFSRLYDSISFPEIEN